LRRLWRSISRRPFSSRSTTIQGEWINAKPPRPKPPAGTEVTIAWLEPETELWWIHPRCHICKVGGALHEHWSTEASPTNRQRRQKCRVGRSGRSGIRVTTDLHATREPNSRGSIVGLEEDMYFKLRAIQGLRMLSISCSG
jgi:hypothetical protein